VSHIRGKNGKNDRIDLGHSNSRISVLEGNKAKTDILGGKS